MSEKNLMQHNEFEIEPKDTHEIKDVDITIEPFLPDDEKFVKELGQYIIDHVTVEPDLYEYTSAYDDFKDGSYVVKVEPNGGVVIEIGGGAHVGLTLFFRDQVQALEKALPNNEFVKRICANSKKAFEETSPCALHRGLVKDCPPDCINKMPATEEQPTHETFLLSATTESSPEKE